jgi:hypothetical protein
MRAYLFMAGLVALPAPALAQAPAAAAPSIEVPRELTDPAMVGRMTKTMQGMSKALLDLKVGEMQAAVEGRQATPAEKKLRVRDVAGVDDKTLQRQIAEAGPKIAQSMDALAKAMPAIVKALDDASRAIDRAAANMPDPTYPRR